MTTADLARITTAFPDYDVATLPDVPSGFVYGGSHGDTCPLWYNETAGLLLATDWPEPSRRFCGPDWPRFAIYEVDTDGTVGPMPIAGSDDWDVVTQTLALHC